MYKANKQPNEIDPQCGQHPSGPFIHGLPPQRVPPAPAAVDPQADQPRHPLERIAWRMWELPGRGKVPTNPVMAYAMLREEFPELQVTAHAVEAVLLALGFRDMAAFNAHPRVPVPPMPICWEQTVAKPRPRPW